jgi:type II secretory pathway pseudopilin PulG
MLIVIAILAVVTGMAIPILGTSMSRSKVTAAATGINGAFMQARYLAIRNSQTYTLSITTPQNTYVIVNAVTGIPTVTLPNTNTASPIPLPSLVQINGGAAAVYGFTFCPNGMVYGAGGVCPNGNLPPALSLTYQKRQTNMSFSTVGNVTTTLIH